MIYPIKEKIKNINLVVGCPIGCRYCYARANCNRFHITDDFSKPQFFEQKLRLFERKTAKNYFLTGMSDVAFWQEEWLQKAFEKMAQTPNTNYIFLTKRPERLHIPSAPDNAWFGVTITCAAERDRLRILKENVRAKHYHVTFEPLSDAVGEVDLSGVDWVVIGTETGNCRGKTPSRPAWVHGLHAQAKSLHIPTFFKEDLLGILPEEEMTQELPPEFEGGAL